PAHFPSRRIGEHPSWQHVLENLNHFARRGRCDDCHAADASRVFVCDIRSQRQELQLELWVAVPREVAQNGVRNFFTLQNLQSSVANLRGGDCSVGSWIGVKLLSLKLLKPKERILPQGADVLFESIRLRHHVRKFRPRPSTMYHIEVAEKSRERDVQNRQTALGRDIARESSRRGVNHLRASKNKVLAAPKVMQKIECRE